MKKRLFKGKLPFIEATSTLVGCVIGAGIFGIPYVIAQAGFAIGLLQIILLGIVILFLHLLIGEVCLRTKGIHMLTGYAEKYLGKPGKILLTFSMSFIIIGALIAYTIGVGEALTAIFSGPSMLYSLLFFALMAVLIFFGLRVIKGSEVFFSVIMLVLVIILMAFAISHMSISNLTPLSLEKLKWFLPYGVILFAFAGSTAIPEMKEEIRKNKKQLKKTIIIGSLIPLILYAIFAFVVVSITGMETTEVATIGLGEKIGPYMVLLGNFFAIFAMATSFLVLGLALEWMLHYDYHIKRMVAWLLTCAVPLLLFLGGVRRFITTIGVAGAVSGGIEGIVIVLMARRAKKLGERKPEYSVKLPWFIMILLIMLFVCGIAYQFLL